MAAKKRAQPTKLVRDLETISKAAPPPLRSILDATALAARMLEQDEAFVVRELEALRTEADALTKRLGLWQKSHPAHDGVARKKADERIEFLKTLRHSMSAWRLPMPSATRRSPPTLRDVAAQLTRALEHEHGRALAAEAGVIFPTQNDMLDAIMREWAHHTTEYGDYHAGDSGSQQMVVDAFQAVGFPKRVAHGLYDFEAHRKRASRR